MPALHERIRSLLGADHNPGLEYYALTILLGDSGKPEFSCFSGWVGYTDENPRREIREASIVHADRMLAAWKEADGLAMVVNTPEDFGLFFSFGGHAVVEQQLAKSVIPKWLAPGVSVHVGEWGYASPGILPPSAMHRAPTPKLRMSIIKRDNYKCRVCGRSPNTNTDIELHVHHIRPWAAGGVTEERNLMTLCHSCHNGLEPHYEFSLFRLLPANDNSSRVTAFRRKLEAYQAEAARESRSSDV